MDIANPIKKYHHDKTTIYSCQYHVIFCPKYRRKVLIGEIAERFKELALEKQAEWGYEIIEMEVMPDHVHMLLSVNPTKYGIDNIIAKIKGYTGRTLRKEHPELVTKMPSMWTRSKFISTVGSVSLDVVKKYIEEQKNK